MTLIIGLFLVFDQPSLIIAHPTIVHFFLIHVISFSTCFTSSFKCALHNWLGDMAFKRAQQVLLLLSCHENMHFPLLHMVHPLMTASIWRHLSTHEPSKPNTWAQVQTGGPTNTWWRCLHRTTSIPLSGFPTSHMIPFKALLLHHFSKLTSCKY